MMRIRRFSAHPMPWLVAAGAVAVAEAEAEIG
jgi:hypothetical protein